MHQQSRSDRFVLTAFTVYLSPDGWTDRRQSWQAFTEKHPILHHNCRRSKKKRWSAEGTRSEPSISDLTVKSIVNRRLLMGVIKAAASGVSAGCRQIRRSIFTCKHLIRLNLEVCWSACHCLYIPTCFKKWSRWLCRKLASTRPMLAGEEFNLSSAECSTFHTGCDVTGGRSERLPEDLVPPPASTATDDVIYYVRRVPEDLLNFTFVRITEVFKEATDETFTDAHWSLRLQCIFLVYKGFCLWRDWQLTPVWLWISPCVIECWCEMASQERSLCSLKDLLLNQNVGEKNQKDATKQTWLQHQQVLLYTS